MTSTRQSQILALGLGGNVGDPERSFAIAIEALDRVTGPFKVAGLYRTAPIAALPQPDYLNTVIVGASALEPLELLAAAKELELGAGRRPSPPASPRPLDIDLLLYGEGSLSMPELILPHPRLRHRRFVLAPLAELVPDLPVPPDGRRVRELLADLGENQRVQRVSWQLLPPSPGPE